MTPLAPVPAADARSARALAAIVVERTRLQSALTRAEAEVPRDPDERRDALRRRVDALAAEVAAAEHEVRALRASWSWRLTAPLRWVAARLPGGGRRP
jgi:hypothetical protein